MDDVQEMTAYFKWGFWTTAIQTASFTLIMAVVFSFYIGHGPFTDDESVFLMVGLWTNTAILLAAIIIAHYLLLQRTLNFVESGQAGSTVREVVEEVRHYPRRYTLIVFGYLATILFSLSFIVLILASFFTQLSLFMIIYVMIGWLLLSVPPAYLQYSSAELWSYDVEARLKSTLGPPLDSVIPLIWRLGMAFGAVLLVTVTIASHIWLFKWSLTGITLQVCFLGGFLLLVIQRTTRALYKQQELMQTTLAPFETDKPPTDETRALWSAIVDARQQLELWRNHRRESEALIGEQVQQVSSLLGSERITSTDSGLTSIMASLHNLTVNQRRILEEVEGLRSIIANGMTQMESGIHLLDESARSIQVVHEEALASSRRAVELSMHMAQIEDVIRIIAYVTDQTRILAFNASIETAGAGELGERFGVVAKEIRQLAQNIGSSAETINRIIHDVQKATHISVMAVEKELKHAEEALHKAGEAQNVFSQVDVIISATNESAGQAGENLREQSILYDKVVGTIRDVESRLRELLARQNDLSVTFSKLKDSFEKWSSSSV